MAELKKDAKLKNIPVVIFSTSSSQVDKDETSKLGATYIVTKPSDFKTLGEKISTIFEQNDPAFFH
jgi:DNA-binding response OmpR family regulator